MAFNKRLFIGGTAACLTETTDIFGGSTGKALYSMDYDASDTSGVYDGTPTNVDFGVSGQINTGARFNGSSSLIAIGSPIPNTDTNVAISAWVKLNSGISGHMHITGTGITTAASEAPFRATLQYQSANTFRLFALRQVAGTYYLADNSTLTNVTMNADVWYHVVWSYNATGRQLSTFLNGTPIDTNKAMSTSGSSVNDSTTVIGSFRSTSGPFFDGTIDQLRIFSSTIDSTQASTLAAETACVHTSTTDNNDFPVTNAAYYKLDNSSVDSHSGTYDLTESNIEYRFGRYGQAGVFNGTNGYLYASNSVQQPTTNFSVSVWVLFHQIKTASTGVIGNFKTGVTPQIGWAIAHQNGTPLQFWADGTAGSSNDGMVQSTSSIPTNEWIHVVGTYDGSNVKIYINGTLENTKSYTQTPNTTDQPLVIGRWYGNYDELYTDGQIDQVRIFSTAISQANVTSLYNEKPEIDTSNFKTVLYKGTGVANLFISNVGMDLETSGGLVWIKDRDESGYFHQLYDSVRGEEKVIFSNSPLNEFTRTGLTSFENNGFFLGTHIHSNEANKNTVAWVWKGGGVAVPDNNGTNITSSVSANVSAGFSIVKWQGDGDSSSSVGHGLTVNSENMLVFIKDLDDGTSDWMVITNNLWTTPQQRYLKLTAAAVDTSNANIYNVDNTTFKNAYRNVSSSDYIAYCFHSVSGYQKIGSYSQSDFDGSNNIVVTTGFKPQFIIIKEYVEGSASWVMIDSARDTTSPHTKYLFAESDGAEQDNTVFGVQFTSTGFQINSGGNYQIYPTNSSKKYIYLAIK